MSLGRGTYAEGLVGLEVRSVLVVDLDAELLHAVGTLAEQVGEDRNEFVFDGHTGAHERNFRVVDVGDGAGGARDEFVPEFLKGGVISTGVKGDGRLPIVMCHSGKIVFYLC